MLMVGTASAHEWYSDYRNPLNPKEGCCGGDDCVPLSFDQVEEVKDGWYVTTFDYAPKNMAPYMYPGGPLGSSRGGVLGINPDYPKGPKRWFVPKAMGRPVHKIERGETGYHICIWGGEPKCFFFPVNT